jgi:hypothetical protein
VGNACHQKIHPDLDSLECLTLADACVCRGQSHGCGALFAPASDPPIRLCCFVHQNRAVVGAGGILGEDGGEQPVE